MAQTQKPTYRLYQACAEALQGTVAHDTFKAICMGTADMSAFTEYSTVSSESSVSGLARSACGSIFFGTISSTLSADQVCGVLVSTAGASATIFGFHVVSNSTAGQGNSLMWCSYNASQAMEANDVITNTGKVQFKLGS